jgi:hypothetical protein
MNARRFAPWASIFVVAAAVVAGLFFVGLPSEQRVLRLDERRIADLRQLQYAVDAYWYEHRELPGNLAGVVDGRRLSRLPLDPTSDQSYEYRATEERRYELCATFARPSPVEDARDFWSHEAGRKCFSFEVTARDDLAR